MPFISSPAMRPSLLKLAGAAALAALLATAPIAAWAQDASSSEPAATEASSEPAAPDAAAQPDPGAVVATVNGSAITEADLAFMYDDLSQQLQNVPSEQLRAILVAQMIDLKLVSGAGAKDSLDQDALFKQRVAYLTDMAMRSTYINKELADAASPEAIQAEYDKQVAALPSEDEIHAAHILVTTEDDAKAIKAQLDGGADFATLAKEKSIEPGAKDSGGDLGYFTHDQMVPAFADAAFALQVGQVSDPVQTQFGWHVIKLEDRRAKAKPTLESMTSAIARQLTLARYQSLVAELRTAATIDIPDAALKTAVDQQLNGGAQ